MSKLLSIVISTLFFSVTWSQEAPSDLIQAESLLSEKLNKLRKTRDDEKIKEINKSFKEQLASALELEGAFDHPFQNLTSIGKIYSDDKLVRVITWNTQFENKLHNFHGFIMKKDERRDKVHVVELNRVQQHYGMLRGQTVTHENWYGCLYYDIVDVKKRNKTYYTLLGYDPNNQRSSIKLIDVLYFTGKFPNFGYPLFETENGYQKRVVFEHSNQATMSLRYDERRDKIIFDHLSPESPSMKEFREYYVPDMSYDAYEFKDNKWRLKEDIIAINKEEQETVEMRTYDAENDTVLIYSKENEWQNPEGKNVPIDGGSHKAVLPEDLSEEEKEKKKRKEKRSKRKKKGFNGVSFTKLGKENN
tara:strand:+ start:6041 stop:7123 length:1083 start_codon:yes stop_codon:yes gene_type:complete